MKIRTITLGLPGIPTPAMIKWAGKQLERAADHFISQGYTVQTRRIALGHWDTGIGSIPEIQRTSLLQMVDSVCAESSIDFCSVGMTSIPEQIEHMAYLLVETRRLNASAEIGCAKRGTRMAAIRAAAQAVRYLASNTTGGFGNFRFGAGACLEAGTPFFPGSYHQEERPVFTIGFENSDLLVKAFREAEDLEIAKQRLFDLLAAEYRRAEESALSVAEDLELSLGGLDTSIAPSLYPEESIVWAFRGVNIEFGERGTLTACGIVTDVLKSIPVKRIGYCGIMLPVLEDIGLAQAADEGRFGLTDLIAYSSVCGVGVDMVPIPGDVNQQQLEALMLDVSTMAFKLRKPLSVRVLPIPGKRIGEKTQFESEHVCNARVMSL